MKFQVWRLERMVYNDFYESGMEEAHKRKSDSDPAVKSFIDTVPQTADPVLTLLRFEAFVKGWQSTIDFDREKNNSMVSGRKLSVLTSKLATTIAQAEERIEMYDTAANLRDFVSTAHDICEEMMNLATDGEE